MDLNPKDPIFTSQQTDSSFILTSHLQEYGRRNINIEINEDGSIITISGEQAEKMKGFRRTFRIPEGVVLDKVKARFDQDVSRLTIKMPKLVKGLMGTGIQGLEDTGKGDTSKQESHQEIQEGHVMSNGTKDQQHKITQSEDQESVYDKDKQVAKIEEQNATHEAKPYQQSSTNISIPILAGSSALFVSLIVIAFNFFRSRHESNQKRH
uniref:uncharacterized protein LOC122590099 n=1 Tax=Erigeron canadensis TaxID=72917 RepID=UPI001CB974F3|nr:uncharacterized protein LOC122590099 [Erigeron canadensis]